MATTIASDLAAGQLAFVGEARFTMERSIVCAELFNKVQLPDGSKSYYVPKFGQIAATDLTDGVDMTDAQSLTITGTTHTTDEAGCKVIITKKLREQMKADAYRAAGLIVGNAMAQKIDEDGVDLFSGLNSGLGSAGTVFSTSYMHAAVAQCYGQDEPVPDPLYFVLHPYQYHDAKTNLAIPTTSNIPPDMQKAALVGKWRGFEPLWGVPIFIDANIDVDADGDGYGAIFSKSAFMYIVGWEPENWVEYDASLRGWEIGIVSDYAMVEEDGTYGRYLLFDCAAPTA